MEAITKRLPLLAFVLAAFAAVAFTSPKSNTGEYGQENGIWYDVTNTAPSPTTYECDSQVNEDCLFDQPFGMGSPISDPNRIFVVRDADNLELAQ
jgi:hypothetical protein